MGSWRAICSFGSGRIDVLTPETHALNRLSSSRNLRRKGGKFDHLTGRPKVLLRHCHGRFVPWIFRTILGLFVPSLKFYCSENVKDSLTVHVATLNMLNLKSVALPVPEIIGAQKTWAVTRYTHTPFSRQFLGGLLFGWSLRAPR